MTWGRVTNGDSLKRKEIKHRRITALPSVIKKEKRKQLKRNKRLQEKELKHSSFL